MKLDFEAAADARLAELEPGPFDFDAEIGSRRSVRACRLTVYVASAPGFREQHLVAHAASGVLLQVLGPVRGRHARAALGLAGLPLGSPVEVDGVFEVIDEQ